MKNKTRVPAGETARINDLFDYEPHGWDGDAASKTGEDVGPAS